MGTPKNCIPENFKKEYMKYYNNEIKSSELCKKFSISRTTIRNWRNRCNLPQVDKHAKKETPENFKEEYMRYYNGEISQRELCKKFKVSQIVLYRWRDECNLPVAYLKKEIPENFEEEYMKCCRREGELKELCKKLNISEFLLYRWKHRCNLPDIYPKKEIPENFEEEYMKFYRRETGYKKLCHKFNITWYTLCKWRNKLNLPKVAIAYKKEIPENFEEEYMKYYYREISCKELRKEFSIDESTLLRWRDSCDLPCVKGRRNERKISENFEEEYMKYYHKKISKDDLCKKFNISYSLFDKWRNRCHLPHVIKSPFEEAQELPMFTVEDFDDFTEY